MNRFEKIVSGNFNQGCSNIFGYSAGKQCSCITLTSVCWTTVRKVTIWKNVDLDFILRKGDKVYKDVNIDRYLNVDELPTKILIDNSYFDIFVIRVEDFLGSSLSEDTDRIINTDLFFSDNVTGIILFIEGYCVSILKEYSNPQVVYAFDSHSRDSEGNIVPQRFFFHAYISLVVQACLISLVSHIPHLCHEKIFFHHLMHFSSHEIFKKNLRKIGTRTILGDTKSYMCTQ